MTDYPTADVTRGMVPPTPPVIAQELPLEGPAQLLAAALDYAARGWPVFPLKRRGKVPALPSAHRGGSSSCRGECGTDGHGLYDATTDPDRIRAWWARFPHANIGIRTGTVSGLVVVDIDPPDGERTLEELEEQYGTLPETVTAITGRNGTHYLFSSSVPLSGGTGALGTNIDLKAEGGYIVAAPSVHENGTGYIWATEPGTELAPLPAWIPELLEERRTRKKAPSSSSSTGTVTPLPRNGTTTRYAAVALREQSAELARVPRGERNDALFVVAARMGALIAGGQIERHYVEAALRDACTRNGLLPDDGERAFLETVKSGFGTGEQNPELPNPSWQRNRSPVRNTATEPMPPDIEELEELSDDAAGILPDAFWTARPVLEHIRTAAHSRNRSAPAVLHAVLARVAASMPPTLELPPIVGDAAGLSYFVALVAPSGSGKSSSAGIAHDLLPIDGTDIADMQPIGSGEGLAELLFDVVEETDDDGKKQRVKRQVRHGAFLFVDEGQVLADMGARSGATLLPTLRTIWTGGSIGQTNASSERKRVVPARSYVFGIVSAFQESTAAALLSDEKAGTPQRFAWARATDPTIPDTPLAWPGPLNWTPPTLEELDPYRVPGYSTPTRHHVGIVPPVADEIRAADLARARGEVSPEPLDAHGGLLRLKIAALLAFLEGRLIVTADDWELAQVLKASSDAVRGHVVAHVSREAARTEAQTAGRLADRAVLAEIKRYGWTVTEVARALTKKVKAAGADGIGRSDLRRSLSQGRREHFEEALEHALEAGWIARDSAPGQGTEKQVFRPGPNRPPA